jgi:hypothetical protein
MISGTLRRGLGVMRNVQFPRHSSSSSSGEKFGARPGPPRLPKEEQEEFERLQREAQQSWKAEDGEGEPSEAVNPAYRKPYEEFQGEVNPVTGEVGGPKQDPLRHGDYSFNGRVTDF